MSQNATSLAHAQARYDKLAVAGAVFFLCLEVLYFALSDRPSFWLPSADGFNTAAIGRDFLNMWMAGRSALAEGPIAWFDLVTYNAYLREFMGRPDLHDYFWSYPPHILLFVWPLGLMPYLLAYAFWSVVGMALFLFAAHRSGIEGKHLLLLAAAPAAALNVFLGQNGFFTAALLIGGLTLLDRRPLVAGVLFGILTIKPQLGLLLPVMLVVTGRWRVIAAAAATTAVLVGLTAALYGPEIWVAFFEKTVPQQAYLQQTGEGLLFLQIPSAFYGARLVGLSLSAAWVLQALTSAAAVAATVWTFWHRRDRVLSLALLIVATFLASPYTLNYDMVIFGWVVALLREREDAAPLDHHLAQALWLLPVAMMLIAIVGVPFAQVLLLVFAGRLLWRLSRQNAQVSSALPERTPAFVDASQVGSPVLSPEGSRA